MITSGQIRWVAGILEGEGTFSIVGHGSPVVKLKMTDLDIIERVRSIVDPKRLYSITRTEGDKTRKPSYTITLNGTRAIQWMMTIYPLMGLRRKSRIRELLHLWKSQKRKNSNQPRGHYKGIQLIMLTRKVSREEAEKIYLEAMMEE